MPFIIQPDPFPIGSFVRAKKEYEDMNGNALLHKDVYRVVNSDKFTTSVASLDGKRITLSRSDGTHREWHAPTYTWELAYDQNDLSWWLDAKKGTLSDR